MKFIFGHEFLNIGYMQDVKYVFIVQKERSFIFN